MSGKIRKKEGKEELFFRWLIWKTEIANFTFLKDSFYWEVRMLEEVQEAEMVKRCVEIVFTDRAILLTEQRKQKRKIYHCDSVGCVVKYRYC